MPLLKPFPHVEDIFIEVSPGATNDYNARCFRFDKDGNSEYAYYFQIVSNINVRWYGHQWKREDFTFL